MALNRPDAESRYETLLFLLPLANFSPVSTYFFQSPSPSLPTSQRSRVRAQAEDLAVLRGDLALLPRLEVVGALGVGEVRELGGLRLGYLLGPSDLDALDVLEPGAAGQVGLQGGVVRLLVTGRLDLDGDVRVF